ncbi:MAG: electron transfer flavoprotein subunit alpha/FixB family protein, partial [Planctomycetota bacterium]
EALGAVLDLGRALPDAQLRCGLFGADVQAAADQLAGAGLEQFLAVQGADFTASCYANDAAAATALVEASAATLVVAPATTRLARCLPGVAQRLGAGIDTQVTGLNAADGTVQIQRWYYRQRMLATATRSERPWLLTIAPGVFPAAAGAPGKATLQTVAVELTPEQKRTRVLGIEAASAKADTIRSDADVLLVAGAGWSKKQQDGQVRTKDAESLILGFLELARASLGGTKSIVDQAGEGDAVLSFMSHLNQVGQTGSTPRHPKGLATCCHGEEPHVVGWRFVQQRRAVNLDAGCGWARGKADVLYVADAFAVMAKVNELLA